MYIYHIFFIYSPISAHLDCFYILAIMNNASVNIGVSVSFQINVFIVFGKISINGIVWLHGSTIFSFLRNLHTVLHSGFINFFRGLFDDTHSDRWEVIFHHNLICKSQVTVTFNWPVEYYLQKGWGVVMGEKEERVASEKRDKRVLWRILARFHQDVSLFFSSA